MKRGYTIGAFAVALCLGFAASPCSAYAVAEDASDGLVAEYADIAADSANLADNGAKNADDPVSGDIEAKSLSDSNASVSLDVSSFEYTGVAIEPVPRVVYGGQSLVEGVDYAVSYADNVIPGTGTVILTGMGAFAGSEAHITFDIVRSEENLIALPGSWQHDSAGWWYAYAGGGYPRGCVCIIDGVSYRFDDRGYMYSGWYTLESQWHYSYPNGARASGWVSVDGVRYYLDPQSGAMRTGWALVDGEWYYLESSGAMRTGWISLGGAWYWLDSSGAMARDWRSVGGSWYYFSDDGAMRTGWTHIDGSWYFLAESGAMETGWLLRSGTWYYLLESGVMVTGPYEVSGDSYIFDDDGAMRTGWISSEDGWIYASTSGALASGWAFAGSYWYWLDPDNNGVMVAGMKEISGSTYMFESDGHMLSSVWFDAGDGKASHASASGAIDLNSYGSFDEAGNVICPDDPGWEMLGASWYYFRSNGVFAKGWEQIEGTWYYFRSDGTMATEWESVGGTWYYFYSNGAMATGWVYVDQKWYYLASSGAMVTGWNTIDSHYYQFGSDGAMREAESAAATDLQRRVVSACNSVSSPGPGLCSEWVAMVFSRIGQGQKLPNNDYDADDMFYAYCNLSDLDDLRVGMIIAVPSHTHTHMGSIYGHICIYVGNNTVMDNIGRIRTMALEEWLSYYTTTYSPKWGWYNHYALE